MINLFRPPSTIVVLNACNYVSMRPPVVRYITFLVYLLDLPVKLRMSFGLYFVLQTCPFNQPHIKFLFVRPRFCSTLPSAPSLTADALRFPNTSSTPTCVVDFHLLVIYHARHTKVLEVAQVLLVNFDVCIDF